MFTIAKGDPKKDAPLVAEPVKPDVLPAPAQPLAVQTLPALADDAVESLDGIKLVRGGVGHLLEFTAANSTAGTLYLQLHNTPQVPPNGVKPKRVWDVATLVTFDGVFPTGRPFRNGLCLVWSSTKFTLTAVTTDSGPMEATFAR